MQNYQQRRDLAAKYLINCRILLHKVRSFWQESTKKSKSFILCVFRFDHLMIVASVKMYSTMFNLFVAICELDNPCRNGATCRLKNSLLCFCNPGYTGVYCEARQQFIALVVDLDWCLECRIIKEKVISKHSLDSQGQPEMQPLNLELSRA